MVISEQPAAVEQTNTESVGRKVRRPKSTVRFPYYSLADSITLSGKIYTEAGDRCTLEQLRGFLGNTAVDSGAFRSRVGAASLFGLVDAGEREVALTQRAKAIFSMHPVDAQRAKVEAFLAVPLFSQLYERYRGRGLPPKVGLMNVFEEMGVVRNQKERAHSVFERSAEVAGFFSSGREYLVEPVIKSGDSRTDPAGGGGGAAGHAPTEGGRPPATPPLPPPPPPTGIHPAILGLLQLVPSSGSRWQKARKEEWLTAFRSTINVMFPDLEDEQ